MGWGGGGNGRGLDEGEENIPSENVVEEEEGVLVVVVVVRRMRTSPPLLHLTRPFPGMERVQAH